MVLLTFKMLKSFHKPLLEAPQKHLHISSHLKISLIPDTV